MGNLARGPGFGQLSRTRFGADAIGPFVKEPMSPMSAVYPLHLQREIDRRWLQRSEQTASFRARLKVMIDGLREAAVTHEQDERPPSLMLRPQGAPSSMLRL